MDKRLIILGLLLAISLSIVLYLGVRLKTSGSNEGLLKKYGVNKNSIPKGGLVPDEETATKLAEIVFEQIYGKSINDKKPYEVRYDKAYKAWVINGSLKANEIGGVPYIIIKKDDGEVVAVWHTK